MISARHLQTTALIGTWRAMLTTFRQGTCPPRLLSVNEQVSESAALFLAFLPASAYVAAAITHFVSFEVGNLIEAL